MSVRKGERGGWNHMISEKQTNAWRETEEEEEKRGEEDAEEGGRGGYGVGIWLLLVVVVADGGQSLAYCHSPRPGQITSEHCLAGQVQNP